MVKGGLEFPAEVIAGIGSHSFASLHDRMPVGNVTRLGHGLSER